MQTRCYNLILFGGGLDSVCLAEYLRKNQKRFDLLHIDYGQKAFVGENASAQYFANHYKCLLKTINTNTYSECNNPILNKEMAIDHQDNVLALRNQVLFDIATIYAYTHGYRKIFVGFHKEPKESTFYDATYSFLTTYNKLLYIQRIPIEFLAPFTNVEQQNYINYTNKTLLLNSFSCYESRTTIECGQCTHCKHKQLLIEKSSNAD